MIHAKPIELPLHAYPAEPWRVVERQFYPRFLPTTETIFATANGYFGMRGNLEEGRPVFRAGTFVNGFYESWPIVYGEEAYGFAKTGQTIVTVPDCKVIKLYVDDEPFILTTASLVHFERALDMRAGTLDREIVWQTPVGKRVSIKSRRLVSFEHRHLAAISYEVTVLDASAPVVISSELVAPARHEPKLDTGERYDPRRSRLFAERVLLPRASRERDDRIVLGFRTRHSDMRLACGIEHLFETACASTRQTRRSAEAGKVVFSVEAEPGVPIRLTKFIAYHKSRTEPEAELCERTERTLDRGARHGFDDLLTSQREYLDAFWERSDIELRGDARVQQAIRFNLFHVFQATARAEGVGMPAKGMTGDGYEGQYFWDAEVYVLPFLTYTSPRVARNLLRFRHGMLAQARDRARQMNQQGALFPWRTITGEEASAYYAAGTAQYHINADIVYALRKYVQATGDEEFLHGPGVEILVETARLWRDLGFYSERRGGRFVIHGVTGPDEYNTVVNNNTFTNLMARENLWYAASTLAAMRTEQPARFGALEHELGLAADEIAEWKHAADHMYVPYDERLGIHPQDDDFLDRKPWDFASTPDDRYPLLLHYHPLVIYRHRVIKQADIMLAMFMLGNEFSAEAKRRNFDYYDPLTTGDSSLSCSVQSIVAAEVGYVDKAREYARYAALMDLANVAGNVKDGCHIASMGGTWMTIVYGFAGMRDYGGALTFRPRVPVLVERIRFPLSVRGRRLEVTIDGHGVTYRLRNGGSLEIRHFDESITVTGDRPVTRPLAPEAPAAAAAGARGERAR